MPQPMPSAKFLKIITGRLISSGMAAEKIVATIEPDQKNVAHNLACLLFAGVVDGCRAISHLLKAKFYFAIPKVLRPVMEMSVDLINISNDIEYCECVVLASERSERGNMHKVLDCSGYIMSRNKICSLENKLDNINTTETNLANSKYKNFRSRDKFALANMMMSYNLLHSDYSSNIHGTIYSLQESYGGDGDGSFSKLGKYPGDSWVSLVTIELCLCLGKSVEGIVDLCGYKSVNRIVKFQRALADSRKMAVDMLPDAEFYE